MGALIADVRNGCKIVVEHPSNLYSILHHISEWKEASQFGVREDPSSFLGTSISTVQNALQHPARGENEMLHTNACVTDGRMGCRNSVRLSSRQNLCAMLMYITDIFE